MPDSQAAPTEVEVDAELQRFDQWFQGHLGNSPLTGPERAILKTYLWFMHHGPKPAPHTIPLGDDGT